MTISSYLNITDSITNSMQKALKIEKQAIKDKIKRLVEERKSSFEQLELKVQQQQKNFKDKGEENSFRLGWIEYQLESLMKDLEELTE